MQIDIPNDWDCMLHQRELFNYIDSGGKRAVVVWHRRAGKDSTALNLTASMALDRVGVYWHMLPSQKQARKVVWDGIDREGRRIIDQVFPREIRANTRQQEMQIELLNGSIWQLTGSDNFNSLVGSNPVGVIFSEWSLCNPAAWNYIRPILAENGGWAIFIFTPRGRNHGATLYNMARRNESWLASLRTADDTVRMDGSPIITKEAIQAEREAGMSEDMIQQEFYCSFDAALPGAYYAREIEAARNDKRIGFVPIEPTLEVHTFWDLGISDSMSIWFAQFVGKEIRLINYYEHSGEGMAHYIQYLDTFKAKHNIRYGRHYAPHDIEVRELMSGKSRKDTALSMGLVFQTVPQHFVADGIEALRRLFPRIWIDENRCEQGLNCLASYHREYDEKKQKFNDQPVHDWASHGADSARIMAMAFNEKMAQPTRHGQGIGRAKSFEVF